VWSCCRNTIPMSNRRRLSLCIRRRERLVVHGSFPVLGFAAIAVQTLTLLTMERLEMILDGRRWPLVCSGGRRRSFMGEDVRADPFGGLSNLAYCIGYNFLIYRQNVYTYKNTYKYTYMESHLPRSPYIILRWPRGKRSLNPGRPSRPYFPRLDLSRWIKWQFCK
jgi:hypothetical protein